MAYNQARLQVEIAKWIRSEGGPFGAHLHHMSNQDRGPGVDTVAAAMTEAAMTIFVAMESMTGFAKSEESVSKHSDF